ncbi:acetyl-CoA carboxylase carboxyltransferase subunit alpha [Clostridium boliviensis]|uniref:Multifunctional fusion protein n=1 Tax=Clostridium boliviensis TaxID=318465 RepID=A0ABU4GJA1_9CLOT|nr:acetyl-CoA carboxylase carboxyltransferase subunit alpha [Clostridium boliviensis]MDW2797092.1 acetyl-CoA carboxylase carboxyltransferase subunit alpha [Clostridium boliviensis]
MLRDMFKKTYTLIDSKYRTVEKTGEPNIPEGLWKKCNKCCQPIYGEDVRNSHYICPKCKGYFRVHAYRRIEMTADPGTFEEWDKEMEFENPLDFPGYEKKIAAAREKTGLSEAIVTGICEINGQKTVLGVCDAGFIMSSMGHAVGEKIARAVERATETKLPVILFACSGGARMQEGIVSLMQMAKTSAALKRHHKAGQLYISVLTDPTTGGVTASFAMLGDIILAEPGALIGFAGPRVIEQTIGQKLPEGFQRAEFLMEHGFVDKIVPREEMKDTLTAILRLHNTHNQEEFCVDNRVEDHNPCGKKSGFWSKKNKRSPWDTVQLSRSADRPVASDYIHQLFDDFMEFAGDRYFKDDGAIIGGIATFHGMPVTVIGQEKGKNTKDNIRRNFGMPSPEGYRKALRLMKQAESFRRPIICFVDTPGAFCGLEAEERGQGEAIARNLFEMTDLTVPVLSIVIGEGGSGGALAMAVGNEVWMMENSIYSILSPEGFASILYKDSKKANDAARVMKITAKDLMDLGLIERVIPEEEPACAENLPEIAKEIDRALMEFFTDFLSMTGEELANQRYDRFRRM